MTPTDPIKILFIAGFGRSGSTLLDNVFGSVDGFFSLGELTYVWDRCLRDNRLCGCGVPFLDCPIWTPILERAIDELGPQDFERMVAARESLGPGRVLLESRLGRRRLNDPAVDELMEHHRRIFEAVRGTTGSRVLVDSSKLPTYGYLLKHLPGVEPYYVHLVRDPRAVAFSWLKKKVYDPSGEEPMYMSRFSVASSCKLWLKWNLATEILCAKPRKRYLRLRYEDFVDRPRREVAKIAAFVGEPDVALPFAGENEVALCANHSVGGNPSRFASGPVPIRRDQAWREKMDRRHRLEVLALTWPLFLRYGYPRPAADDSP